MNNIPWAQLEFEKTWEARLLQNPYTGFCLYEQMPSRLRCTKLHFYYWDKLKQCWS